MFHRRAPCREASLLAWHTPIGRLFLTLQTVKRVASGTTHQSTDVLNTFCVSASPQCLNYCWGCMHNHLFSLETPCTISTGPVKVRIWQNKAHMRSICQDPAEQSLPRACTCIPLTFAQCCVVLRGADLCCAAPAGGSVTEPQGAPSSEAAPSTAQSHPSVHSNKEATGGTATAMPGAEGSAEARSRAKACLQRCV